MRSVKIRLVFFKSREIRIPIVPEGVRVGCLVGGLEGVQEVAKERRSRSLRSETTFSKSSAEISTFKVDRKKVDRVGQTSHFHRCGHQCSWASVRSVSKC
jgi:hypothetical protein